MFDLSHGRDMLMPAFVQSLSGSFSLNISLAEDLIYAQSLSDPELKILVATKGELEDRAIEPIIARFEYIRDRYIG